MDKVRLILLNTPVTSLFMASFFIQKELENADWRNVVIDVLDKSEVYIKNEEQINFLDDSFKIISSGIAFHDLVDESVSCNFDSIPCNFDPELGIKGFFQERRKRKAVFKRIRMKLAHLNILSESVKEIWVAHSVANMFFKILFPDAKIIKFEHGTSDIIVACESNFTAEIFAKRVQKNSSEKCEYLKKFFLNIQPQYIGKYLKNKLREIKFFLEEKILYFRNNLGPDMYVSIFGNEIKQCNKNIVVETIEKDKIFEIIKKASAHDANLIKTCAIQEGFSAIILLECPDDFIRVSPAEKEKIKKDYLRAFEIYLKEKWLEILKEKQIKNLFFKAKYANKKNIEQINSMIKEFNKLSEDFNCFSFDLYPLYPFEYYLPLLNPKVIFGAYSTGLFYAKKMLPNIEIFTYDDFFVEYVKKHFSDLKENEQIFDIVWVKRFFEGRGRDAFSVYLPRALGEKECKH